MQQPLCHLYFATVLEHLYSDSKYKDSQPVHLTDAIDKMKESLKKAENADAALLWIDIQAVTQLLLKKIAHCLNPNQSQGLGKIGSLLDDINR